MNRLILLKFPEAKSKFSNLFGHRMRRDAAEVDESFADSLIAEALVKTEGGQTGIHRDRGNAVLAGIVFSKGHELLANALTAERLVRRHLADLGDSRIVFILSNSQY